MNDRQCAAMTLAVGIAGIAIGWASTLLGVLIAERRRKKEPR